MTVERRPNAGGPLCEEGEELEDGEEGEEEEEEDNGEGVEEEREVGRKEWGSNEAGVSVGRGKAGKYITSHRSVPGMEADRLETLLGVF